MFVILQSHKDPCEWFLKKWSCRPKIQPKLNQNKLCTITKNQPGIDMDRSFPFTGMAILNPASSQSPFLQILKSYLYLLANPLAAANFIYQLKQTGGRKPQHLTCGFSCNFGNPINVIQALDQIHNTQVFAKTKMWKEMWWKIVCFVLIDLTKPTRNSL